jgi:uncharacterized membrane protein YgaE (UPF0421/DUF939 family)
MKRAGLGRAIQTAIGMTLACFVFGALFRLWVWAAAVSWAWADRVLP